MIEVEQLIGLSKYEAMGQIHQAGQVFRVSREDDSFYVQTQDFRPNRINLVIESGIIKEATNG